MGIGRTEVNLRRLLAAVPQQQNQAKLVHYVATLRELLEQLAEERTAEGLPRLSKAVLSDYSEKIEAVASRLTSIAPDDRGPQESLEDNSAKGRSPSAEEESHITASQGLRKRPVLASNIEDKATDAYSSTPVKLDAMAQAHIEKHRKLQEDLTDEMVVLARQLKEGSLLVNRSLQDSEKFDRGFLLFSILRSLIDDILILQALYLLEFRYLILQKKPSNLAWRGPVTQMYEPQRYTRRVLQRRASPGL
ncbi:hypothetical protein TIFTF001_031168 [Ficus carica]|uniref:Vesicle transport protein USE1 n=1 Tax=Ficus carica TaxID=3494 RepID=A0AA88E0F4_FICCA|nr:hypothetical protein TIFTF001_031168 [Ficus carica]